MVGGSCVSSAVLAVAGVGGGVDGWRRRRRRRREGRGCVGRRGGRAVEGCRGMGGGSGRCRSGERAPSSSSCGCMEATGALVDVSVDGGGGVLRGARVASEAVGRWTGVVPGPCRAPNHQPHRRSAVMYLPSRRGRFAGDRQVEESPAPPEGWAPRKAFLPYSLEVPNLSPPPASIRHVESGLRFGTPRSCIWHNGCLPKKGNHLPITSCPRG